MSHADDDRDKQASGGWDDGEAQRASFGARLLQPLRRAHTPDFVSKGDLRAENATLRARLKNRESEVVDLKQELLDLKMERTQSGGVEAPKAKAPGPSNPFGLSPTWKQDSPSSPRAAANPDSTASAGPAAAEEPLTIQSLFNLIQEERKITKALLEQSVEEKRITRAILEKQQEQTDILRESLLENRDGLLENQSMIAQTLSELRTADDERDRRDKEVKAKRKLIAATGDVSFPEYPKANKSATGNKGAYFKVRAWRNESERAIEIKASEVVKFGNEESSAGALYNKALSAYVAKQYENKLDNKRAKYDSTGEFEHFKQYDVHSFSDIGSWALNEFLKIAGSNFFGSETDAASIHEHDQGTSERTGPITFGFCLYKMLLQVCGPEDDKTEWKTAVEAHAFWPCPDMMGFREEMNKFRKLREYAELVSAQLDYKKLTATLLKNAEKAQEYALFPKVIEKFVVELQEAVEELGISSGDRKTYLKFETLVFEKLQKTTGHPRRSNTDKAKVAAEEDLKSNLTSLTKKVDELCAKSNISTGSAPRGAGSAPRGAGSTSRGALPVLDEKGDKPRTTLCQFWIKCGCNKKDCNFVHDAAHLKDGHCKHCNKKHTGECAEFKPSRPPWVKSKETGEDGKSNASGNTSQAGKPDAGSKSGGKGASSRKGRDGEASEVSVSPDDSVSNAATRTSEPARRTLQDARDEYMQQISFGKSVDELTEISKVRKQIDEWKASNKPRKVNDDSEKAEVARPARPERSRPSCAPSDTLYYGFLDDGSKSVIRKPTDTDIVDKDHVLLGIGDKAVNTKLLHNGEIACETETLLVIPEGKLQYELDFEVYGRGRQRVFKRGNITLTGREHDGYFWFNKEDTEIARALLAEHYLSMKTKMRKSSSQRSSVAAFEEAATEPDRNSDLPILDTPSMRTFGVNRMNFDNACYMFHDMERMVQSFFDTDKGKDKNFFLKLWDDAPTASYFLYHGRTAALPTPKERARPPELDRSENEKERTSNDSESTFSFPVRHPRQDIPISHFFHHRPRLAGCLHCELANMQMENMLLSELKLQAADSRVEIYVDWVGKRLPTAGDGSKWMLGMGSSLGDLWPGCTKTKEDPELLSEVQRFISLARLDPAKIDCFMDGDGKCLKDFFEPRGGTYNSGIANRKNSHAKQETVVKAELRGLRACTLAAGGVAKHWPSAVRTACVNISRDIQGRHLGLYEDELFIFAECSWVKLEPSVYSPPVGEPQATKVMFLEYNLNSRHALKVEFWDANEGKRRKTEVQALAFRNGLPQERPMFGYKRIEDPNEPLQSVILDLLSPKDEHIKIPQVKETPERPGRPSQKKKGRAKAQARPAHEQFSGTNEHRAEPVSDIDDLVCDLAEKNSLETWFIAFDEQLGFASPNENVEHAKRSAQYELTEADEMMPWNDDELQDTFGVVMDLGLTDGDDFEVLRNGAHPMQVSVGEVAQVSRKARPGREKATLVKTLKPSEMYSSTFKHLNWPAAHEREQLKMFEKHRALRDEPKEISELPDTAQVTRMHSVPTVKNYDTFEMWDASVRLVLGGNNIRYKSGGKVPPVKTAHDVIEPAGLETTRAFVHTQKLRRRKLKQKDADGAYLQAAREEERRPGGLFAKVPREYWPSNSKAWKMRNPVFPVDQGLYGLEEAGFGWDKYAETQLTANGWEPYVDIDRSVMDYLPDSVGMPVPEEEMTEFLESDASLLKYIDDLLLGTDPDAESTTETAIDDAIKIKGGEDNPSRFLGQDWTGLNGDINPETGAYEYEAAQVPYVEKLVSDFKEILKTKNQPPLKKVDTPAWHQEPAWSQQLDEVEGVFSDIARSFVQQCLFVGRCSRVDCILAIQRLSRYVQPGRFKRRHDTWLRRLVGYLDTTSHMQMHFKVDPKDLTQLTFDNFFDADLAGCQETKKSTSGWCGFLEGPNTHALVGANAKRQGATSISTPEAEVLSGVVAAKKSIRLHMLLNRLLGRRIRLKYRGDNAPADKILGSGISQAIAYAKRTQGISLAFASENMSPYLEKVDTHYNTADIFTKPLPYEDFHRHRTYLGIW